MNIPTLLPIGVDAIVDLNYDYYAVIVRNKTDSADELRTFERAQDAADWLWNRGLSAEWRVTP